MLALLGLLLGVLIGYLLPFGVPFDYVKYISVSFLAGLDSVIGAFRADIEDKYDVLVFSSGFISNALIAASLTFMGDRLGVDLYLAALLTFGVRIFQNLGWIRRDLITRRREAQALASGEMPAPASLQKEAAAEAETQKETAVEAAAAVSPLMSTTVPAQSLP